MNNIIQRIDTKLVNPFDIGQHEDEKVLLINIATGTATPPEVSESLRRKGNGRVCPSQANIWLGEFLGSFEENRHQTFQNLYKPIKPNLLTQNY